MSGRWTLRIIAATAPGCSLTCPARRCVALLSSDRRALDPALKCEATKLKTAGKYGFCRLKAEAKAVKRGESADFTKCEATFTMPPTRSVW